MDRELAQLIAKTAFRSGTDLTDMVPMLKEHCEDSEYQTFLRAIATASATIYLEIEKIIFAQYPELENEFGITIKKYGRLI